MGTLFILLIPWITTGLNTFISDGDTYWQSTSSFDPIPSGEYGTIRLREFMRMSLMLQWHGRVQTAPLPITYEQILRVGWSATLGGGCTAQNSRYPSLWIDNVQNTFHLSISQDSSCGEGWRISKYAIKKYEMYSINIEFTNSQIYMKINDTIVLNQTRSSPTRPSFIGQLMNVYIASDYWITPYVIANVSIWNINIQSLDPPTTNPTNYPTQIPTINPTNYPTQIPTPIPSTTTHNPSYPPTNPPTTTIIPSSYPTHFASTENPSTSPTHLPTNTITITNTSDYDYDYNYTNIKYQTSLILFNLDVHKNENKMDASQLLYLLIAGIVSCIIGTCLILITVKKCGDLKKGNKRLRAHRLSLEMKKIGQETPDEEDDSIQVEFQIDGYNNNNNDTNEINIPLKPGTKACSHILAPIPKIMYEIDEGETDQENKNLNEKEEEEDDEEANASVVDTQIIGADGIIDHDNETVLTRTESLSPSNACSRLNIATNANATNDPNNTSVRKYLMSESNEEEYIKAVMEQAVVINNMHNIHSIHGIYHHYRTHAKRLSNNSHLFVITNKCGNEFETIDETMANESEETKLQSSETNLSNDSMITRKGTNITVIEKDNNNNLEILDDDEYCDEYDDETLPILPGTNTTGTNGDGESITLEYNIKIPMAICEISQIDDGYQWITMALLQIDDEDWRIYLNNFKKNKVTENRLYDLKRCDMKELIPKIGPRNEFEKLLRVKLGATLSEKYDNSEY